VSIWWMNGWSLQMFLNRSALEPIWELLFFFSMNLLPRAMWLISTSKDNYTQPSAHCLNFCLLWFCLGSNLPPSLKWKKTCKDKMLSGMRGVLLVVVIYCHQRHICIVYPEVTGFTGGLVPTLPLCQCWNFTLECPFLSFLNNEHAAHNTYL